MQRHIRTILYFVAGVFILSALSCAPESCYEDTVSAVKAGFYETGTGINIEPDSVTVFGMGREWDTLYSSAKNIKSVNIFLDPSTPACSYIFVIDGITDTVTLTYSSFPHLISKECGYSMFHSLESCKSTNNLIDTVIVRDRNIKIPYEENIRIYY